MILVASNQRGGPLFRMEWRDAAGKHSISFIDSLAELGANATKTELAAWAAWWHLHIGQFHDRDREVTR